MKLIHHVKKHGKTITLHLKKHHKKYIFGILSATLLWKGVSLIAAYAVVHNLSFSFADVIHGGDENNVVETEITNEYEDQTNINNEETTTEEDDDELDNENYTNIEDEEDEEDEENRDDNDNNTIEEESTDDEEISTDTEQIDNEQPNDEIISDNETNNNENENNGNDENNEIITTEEEGNNNGVCDYGDINIISPIEGNIIGKTFDISREFTNDDCKDHSYVVKLRDSNTQYLDIFQGNDGITGFSFDSTQLLSGFYDIKGLNESGEEIILKKGDYEGVGTNYFSGHELAIVSDELEIIYKGEEFTIDNKAPEISNIKLEYSTENKKLNIGDTVTISFESDEDLTNTNVTVLGQTALLEEKSGKKYRYTMDFSEKNTTGKLVYGIEYSDNIGNTGYYEGYENIELDYAKPVMSNLEMNYSGENEIKIKFNTNETTDAHIVYVLSGLTKTYSTGSNNKKNHEITLKDIRIKYVYNYSISILDEAKNELNIGGNFYISGNKIIFTNKEIMKSDLITEIGFNDSGNNKLLTKDSFDICAKDIDFINLDLPINGKIAKVKMPKIVDTNVNKLTNAFSVVLVEKLEEKNLSQYAIDEITEDLNNFLIVVKLVKDDNNSCKQNMSQYYINRFRHTLTKYGIVE